MLDQFEGIMVSLPLALGGAAKLFCPALQKISVDHYTKVAKRCERRTIFAESTIFQLLIRLH
jgi:hypothetical protein